MPINAFNVMFQVLLYSSERWRNALWRWYVTEPWVKEGEMGKCVSFWGGWSSQQTCRIQPGNVAQNRDFWPCLFTIFCSTAGLFSTVICLSLEENVPYLHNIANVYSSIRERQKRAWVMCGWLCVPHPLHPPIPLTPRVDWIIYACLPHVCL